MQNVIKTANELKLLKTTDVQILNAINFPEPLTDDTAKSLKDTVAEKQDEYILLFIKLLNNIASEDSVVFLLGNLNTLCESGEFTEAFATVGSRWENVDPIAPFTALLKKDSIAVVEKNWAVLAAILSVCKFEAQEKPSNMLVDACLAWLGGSSKQIFTAVHTLTLLLRSPSIRSLFTTKNGIPMLTKLVVTQSDVQLTYELGFCFWMLSYNDASIVVMLKHNGIAMLHDIIKQAKKEKCTRVAIFTLKNFARLQLAQHGYQREDSDHTVPTVDLEGNRLNIFGDMLGLGLLRTLQLMSRRNYGDADILPEVDALLATLEKNIEDITSFADYKQEVLSGRLDWTPVHKSEKFWKENIKEFEKDDYKILRALGTILRSDEADAKTLTIICHDFGEFVKYHPQGRKILNTLEVKNKILTLMGSDNQEVRVAALLCVQKIMVQKWEFLGA
uniref:V-type proton ATPase subunit H n=1 Tax=Eutreptiella gymnastica TaxID=73025 RepID=A0A7S1N1V3_9EUGL|mmetsp:Transcript_104981/g.181019  ORF Transcript_104981/g.181019 Transcript_104981/m.181019 type:complete len:447 (+) Transcript_104981:76-1416(+)